MKTVIPLSVALMLCISCSRYQYATINGSNGITQNDKLEFVAENDSLRLTYNFNGVNAPINITIQNKLQKPVYIDWQRSALIVNDKAISYMPNEMKIDGGFSGSSYYSGHHASGFSSTYGNIHAMASLPVSIDFIPPQSYLVKNPMGITNKLIQNVPDSAFRRYNFNIADGYAVPVKGATFTESNSPLRFRSYLTLMIGDSTSKPVTYEHSFYISQLINTSQPPQSIWLESAYRGNQFYIKEQTGYGRTMTGFGVIAGTAVVAATVESLGQTGGQNGSAK